MTTPIGYLYADIPAYRRACTRPPTPMTRICGTDTESNAHRTGTVYLLRDNDMRAHRFRYVQFFQLLLVPRHSSAFRRRHRRHVPQRRRAPHRRRRGGGRGRARSVRRRRLAAAANQRTDRPVRCAEHGERRFASAAVLRAAFGVPHVHRAVFVTGVQLHLWFGGGPMPATAHGADTAARHPAVGADPRLPVRHGHHLDGVVPRLHSRRGGGVDLRDLHQPGMEHDLLLLPFAAQRTAGVG